MQRIQPALKLCRSVRVCVMYHQEHVSTTTLKTGVQKRDPSSFHLYIFVILFQACGNWYLEEIRSFDSFFFYYFYHFSSSRIWLIFHRKDRLASIKSIHCLENRFLKMFSRFREIRHIKQKCPRFTHRSKSVGILNPGCKLYRLLLPMDKLLSVRILTDVYRYC